VVIRPAAAYIVETPPVVAVEHRQVLVQHGGYAWQRSGHHW
jgi:hypothetical protein